MPHKSAQPEPDDRYSRAEYVKLRDLWMKHILGKDWLPDKCRIIGCRIALYANFDQQYANPSVVRIAADTGTSVRTVLRAIERLDDEKLLKVDRRKRGVNRYHLIF